MHRHQKYISYFYGVSMYALNDIATSLPQYPVDHYNDIIMGAMASHINSLTIV